MPDGMNFLMPADAFRRLLEQADLALANGDEEQCTKLINRIYEMLDDELTI